MSSNNSPAVNPKSSSGFYVQAVASFAVSTVGLMIAIIYLPVDAWTRAFLGLAVLFTVSSTITISKVVRDKEEAASIYQRVDAARLEKILADYDPLRPITLGGPHLPASYSTTETPRVGQDR